MTPKGQIVIDPSIEYDYWAQNQLGVNGFQIIPGIFFGNVFATRFEQNITTAAVTLRGGVTDRLELNAKIPFVYNTGSTTSLIPVGPNAQILSVGANGAGIGDVQGGASYQFNSGENGWPIFVGNFLFKTVTGTSPFHWPDPVPSAACAWPPPSDDKLKCPRRRTGGAREPHASGAVSTGYLEPYIAEQARSDSAASYGTRWPEKPPTHERCGSY